MVKNLPTVERSTRIRFGKNCKDDQAENTIVFNASNVQIEANTPGAVYLTPIRLRENYEDPNIVLLMYNKETNEITESGEAATDIIQPSLESATRFGNVSSVSTVQFNNALTSFVTLSNVGIANAYPQHTLDIGANVAIDVVGSNVISVLGGNVYIQKDLVVDGNTRINGNVTVVNTENLSITDAIVELGRNNTSGDTTLDLGLLMNRPNSNVVIGFREGTNEIVLGYTQSSASNKTFTPKTDEDIDVHVYGRVLTEANVGIINTSPIHTLDVGSNLYVDEFGSNILVVRGNTNVTGDLTVDTNTLFVDSVDNKVGIKTVDPHAELHVVGNAYVSSNLTVDTDTLHVDALNHSVGIETTDPDANLHVVGNVYVSSNLTVDTDTLHVDALTHSVGIETKTPSANLHVVGNVYVSKDLTIDTDTLHVDALTHSVGIETKTPSANLHVVGNAYVSSNLTVDTDTFHVDALNHSVGIETKTPSANLHVVGNAYVSSNLTVDTDTFHVDALNHSVGIETTDPDANLHVVGNVYVSSNLTVDTDTLHVDALTHSVGIETKTPSANLHVVGNVYVSKDLTVDTDTLHVDTTNNRVGIETKTPSANLHVVGNVYVSSNLTVDTDTLHVDALTHSVGIETKTPSANLHVVGNVYVSKDLTVDTDTLHVDTTNNRVGIETKTPSANLHVVGNVYVSSNLTVDTDTLHVDALTHSVGIETKTPSANLHVVGNAYVSSNLTVDTDTLHVDTTNNRVGIETKTPSANLHVVGNVYVSSNLTIDTDTLHVDALTHSVGIETKTPSANLHVVGNAYVSSNLTVDTDTLHVDTTNNRVGIETKTPSANLHVVGNVYVSSNLTIDTDTLHVDALTHSVGIETKTPSANLHVVGNAYVSSNLTVDTDTLHVDTNRVGIETKTPSANLHHVSGIDALTQIDKDPSANLHVVGNVYVSSNLTVDTDTLHVDTTNNRVGIETKTPSANLHVVGNVYVSSNLTVDTNTLHVDTTNNRVGIETKDPHANLHVVGNVYVSSNLTVDTDTLHVDTTNNRVGIETKTPSANLHVVGNAYVSSNLTVDTNTLHVDTVADHVGINTKNPDAELHVVGNAYVSSNLTVDTNTLHVDTVADHVGINTKNPDAELHVVGNAYVSSNLTVDTNTLHVDTVADHVGINTKNPDAELHVVGNAYVSNTLTLNDPTTALVTDLTSNVLVKLDQLSNVVINTTDPNESLRDEHILVYDGTNWINDYPKHAYVKVYNDSGEDMEAGNVVYVSGIHNQNLMEVALAKSDSATTMPAIGIVTSAIVSGEEGFAVTYGKVPTVSVDDFIVGETVYVSNVHAGLLTNVKPYVTTTDLIQNVGIVTKSGNGKGALFVTGIGRANDVPNAQIVSELQDMQYVYVNNTNNDFKKIHHQNILYGGNFYKSLVKTFNITNITAYNETSLVGTYPLITNATGGKLRITYSSAESDTDDLEWNLQRKKGDTGTNQTVTFVGGGGSVDAIVDAEWLDGFEQFVLTGNNFSSSANLIVNVTEVELIPDFEFTKGKVDIGSVVVTDTTDTTSSTSGALVVAGGVGIAKDIQVGSNISVAGLKDATNKHLVMTETNGKLTKAPAYVNNDNKFVITAAEAEFLGNLTLSGNTTVVTSNSVTIEDRIFGVAANNSTEGLDSGFMIEHQDDGKYSNIALIYHSNDHRFSIGHTQNTFTDDHILHYQDPLGMKIDLRGDVTVQNTTTLNKTLDVTGVTTLKNDLVVGAASNLFVDVSNSRVGINEASPKKSLDVNGTGRFKDTTDSSSTGTGALLVLGGLGVASNIHATNVYAGSHIGVGLGTASTTVPLEVRASGTGGILVKHTGTAASNHAKLALESNTTTGGDPYITMVVSGGSTFAVGVDNSDSDTFKISQESTLGTNDRLKITTAGVTTVTNTTEATSTGTGALVVSGGLGVASNVNATNVYALGTTNATSKTSGSLQVRGGLGVSGNVYAAKIHTDDYLTHTGDLNTRVGFPVADTFVVETGGTERVRVDSAGRLGVGTTSPSEKISIGFGSDDYPTIEFVNTGTNITRRPASDDYDAYFRGLETTIQRRADVETAFSGTGPVIENSHEIVFGYGEGYDVFTSDDTRYPSYHAMKFNVWSLTRGSGSLTNVMNLLGNGNVGIGTTTPGHTLGVNGTVSVTSGTIINTEQVAKKTYSFSNTIATGSEPEINVYFSSNVFYSKITAQLNDLDNEVSTLVIECSGGSRKGTPLNVAIGTKNIFGGVSTNPWSSTVKVDTDHISFTPSAVIDNTSGGDYHVFIEYTSPDATLGKVTRITKDGSNDVTFDY
jgi:hypothetical protein